MMTKNSKTPFDFEKGMARLEEIVGLFDQGGLTLQEMETYFEEGMGLIQACSARLNQTEVTVTKLLKDMKEKLETEPFEVEEG
ncbi:MAG: exodeoxyribonuclease VII small subunit [bacterium]|jgi:exodeoxyribonuclease VII small subunit|nr:exodeoxyribonuclease VII small subunit [bacterium]